MSAPNCIYKYFNEKSELVIQGVSNDRSWGQAVFLDNEEVANSYGLEALVNIFCAVRDGELTIESARSITSLTINDETTLTINDLVDYSRSSNAKVGSIGYPPLQNGIAYISKIYPEFHKPSMWNKISSYIPGL